MKLTLVDENFEDMAVNVIKNPVECTAPPPELHITPRLRWKMHVLARVVVGEIGKYETFAYVLGTKMGHGEDIIIPIHEVSGASVVIKPEYIRGIGPEIEAKNKERDRLNEIARTWNDELPARNALIEKENEERKKQGEEPIPLLEPKSILAPLKVVGWTHSHVDFGAFSSGTDNEQHHMLHDQLILTDLRDDATVDDGQGNKINSPFYIFGITVNIRKEEYGVIYVSYPCGRRERIEPVPIIQSEDTIPLTTEEKIAIRDAIRADVKNKVKTRDGTSYRYDWNGRSYSKPADSHVKRNLDKYYGSLSKQREIPIKKPSEPVVKDATIVDEIKAQITWKNIINDGIIMNEIWKVKKCIGVGTHDYEVIKEAITTIMERERELIFMKTREIIESRSEVEASCMEEPATIDEQDDSDDDEDDHEEEDDDNEDEDEDDDDEGEDDDDDDDVDQACTSCSVTLHLGENYSLKEDGDGNPLCDDCSEKINDTHQIDETKDTGQLCSSCKSILVDGLNHDGETDEKGNPICIECSVTPECSDNVVLPSSISPPSSRKDGSLMGDPGMFI